LQVGNRGSGGEQEQSEGQEQPGCVDGGHDCTSGESPLCDGSALRP
jgi:hypothetical protein